MAKKKIIFSAIIVILVIVGFGFYYWYTNGFKFKKITYNNGEDSSYNLKFYKSYDIVANSDKVDSDAKPNAQGMFHPIQDDIGLYVHISNSVKKPVETTSCTGALGTQVVFEINGLKFCSLDYNGTPVVISGKYGNADHWFMVQALIGFDFARAKSDSAYAAKVKEVKLSDYTDDIQYIIKSIDLNTGTN